MLYTIYFEIYGKKMKTDVEAKTPHQAQEKLAEIVANKIIYHKVVEPKIKEKKEPINKATSNFMNFFEDAINGKFDR